MKNFTKRGWFQPYVLNPHNIEKVVIPDKTGIYILADLDQNGKARVKRFRVSPEVKNDLREALGKFQLFMYKPLRYDFSNIGNRQQELQLS